MLTCAFIVCLLQIAVCAYGLRHYRRIAVKHFIGHLVALVLATLGAIGTGPLVF